MALRTSQTDLLIIGAGPAGLMAATWASQYNISTRVIDAKPHRTKTGHADGIHSRTLEILDSFGLGDLIVRKGVEEVEMSYWGVNRDSSELECQERARSQPQDLSRFGQMLLNQGEVEQVLIDYINELGRVRIERRKTAEKVYFTDNDTHPVTVEVKGHRADRMAHVLQPEDKPHGVSEVTELIEARYVVGCDGARSLVRDQLNIPLEAKSTDSKWGVIDIVPITDFPDIRQSCAIHSDEYGSIMTAPRENRLVRFYIQLTGDSDLEKKAMDQTDESPDALIQLVQRVIKPYSLSSNHCDWWSIYPIKQGLVKDYQVRNRVFLAGDAAHTHSPKAGQGMNVSIQDTYNLVWKLGSVITGALHPRILETYQFERLPVAEELMRMDAKLVEAYEETKASVSEVSRVRDGFASFMSGVEVTYQPNVLVAPKDEKSRSAPNIRLGMRLETVSVVAQANGSSKQLARALSSNGSWRLLVFCGDLTQGEARERLHRFADAYKPRHPLVEAILIHASPRTSVTLLDLPEIFHPFDGDLGWDYDKVFAAEGLVYEHYGVDKQAGNLVLCRPDQHVAWIGGLDEVSDMNTFFQALIAN